MSEQRLHILVCDDDFEIVQAIQIYLERAGYTVHHAYNGKQALEVLEKQPIHLVLLDIMMPLMDGMEALTHIRESRSLPVILVSAKGESSDKIDGLLGGADDYITKPFNAKELVARVKSQLRRYTQFRPYDPREDVEGVVLRQGTLILNRRNQSVEVDGTPRSLTPLEFSILWLLMEHPGRVYSSEEIYEAVWQEDSAGSVATVAVHIRHIREKIEINPREPRYLKVIWGRGYRMEPQSDPKQTLQREALEKADHPLYSHEQPIHPSISQEARDTDVETEEIGKGGQHE
ncbi:response regulator transcription factor [uncultured Murdochiella sp.]|uniref:response regulator transcription factor n=1 Tax=uncultured Murdochiella sp. TaxID=1586095 RepID=UPI002804855A|nr:response regulator transcription factor [uncultured Murdochiella sp.]